MKRILFGLSLLAVLLVMATTAFAADKGFDLKPWKIIVGPADHYVWQPFNARNQSYIYQSGGSSTAYVNQMNDQNLSWIVQKTIHGKDFAQVYQNSPCCYLSYHGHNWPLFTRSRYQNTSKIFQHGHHTSWGWIFHKAYVYQWGDGNYSMIEQSGTDDVAKVSQHGAFNKSLIEQEGGDFNPNRAYVTQLGDWNYSNILQKEGSNHAKVYQNGFGNVSYIYQVDTFSYHGPANNTAIVGQLGYMNHSAITQVGGGVHSAYVTQANFCFNARIPSCAGVGCK